jgi:hypothetical protein
MGIHAEGYAQMMDEFSLNFIREYKEKYNIKEDYINQRELWIKRRDINIFWNFYQYLKLKDLEESFDYKSEFVNVTNNFGAFTNYETNPSSPFSFFKNISYVFGLDKIKEIHRELIEEFGKENEAIINKALSTGLFNIEVLEDFARYFIQKELK